MRRKNREVTGFDEMVGIMRQCEVCRIALNDDDVPYILPLNFALEVEDGQVSLYFHGATEGRKYELIARNPRCAFEMDCHHKIISNPKTRYCTFQYSSVIGRGTLEILPESEKFSALRKINDSYHPEGFPVNTASMPHTTVMRLRVESMTAKSNVGKIKM